MANRLQKFIYYLSAGSPVLIVFAIVWFIQKSSWLNPMLISWQVPSVLVASSVLMNTLFLVSFRYGKKNLQTLYVKGTEITCGDAWIVAYVTMYLLPLATFKFGNEIIPVVGVVIIALIMVLVFTDYITPHPILYFGKYHFYTLNVEGAASDYYLISRRKIRKADDVKKVAQIFEFLLLWEE